METTLITKVRQLMSNCRNVRESQYMLQIVKCEDRNCCSIPRSSYFNLIIDRFLPPPLPLSQSDDGLVVNLESQNFASLFTTIFLGKKVLPPQAFKQFPKSIPYDYACPTLQSELSKRVCSQCGLSVADLA